MNEEYFTEMYAADPDPWGFDTRWYEARKYALTMAALPRRRYRSAFEPGCSIGVLTAMLQTRCDTLLACDLVPAAVERTRARVSGPGVRVEQRDIRRAWPPGTFDLIVASEMVYYFEAEEAIEFARRVHAQLAPDGHLVTVHWRHPVPDYPMTGDRADELIRVHSGLHYLGGYADADLVLSVLGHEPASVATAEGLVG